ncbi:hypothetical protein AB9K17_24095, partial [Salmonella enterica subsp. enterica serovar Kentucky]|uniref:hypothetical protein n=1 Tax=Salmonella enterica TaxID=28901 RepID=UPI003F4B414E
LFAIGRVGDIRQFCMENLGENVRIEKYPTRMIKSHARIYFPKNNGLNFSCFHILKLALNFDRIILQLENSISAVQRVKETVQ